jgi:hypothetical protein
VDFKGLRVKAWAGVSGYSRVPPLAEFFADARSRIKLSTARRNTSLLTLRCRDRYFTAFSLPIAMWLQMLVSRATGGDPARLAPLAAELRLFGATHPLF